ncbi:MAG TPA: hypothetical protein VN457_01115, partial [Chlamydiales bacterium]|nr:hypothetical protein [Chlamydiales bacterium]
MKEMQSFPPFSLSRLLKTVFEPKPGEKVCILIDLKNPSDVINFAFLQNPNCPVQKKAYELFYQGCKTGAMKEFGLAACDFFAYSETGGSNLELPEVVLAPDGTTHRLDPEIYSTYNIILAIGNFSATAPLTASSKRFHFRGGTLHGLNDIVLKSGLSVDYNEVSRKTEKLRSGMTKADHVDIDFAVDGKSYKLHIDLQKQEAQKSHGICRQAPDVVNLPAGEVYFVPKDASGEFPIKFEDDGTLALMQVS